MSPFMEFNSVEEKARWMSMNGFKIAAGEPESLSKDCLASEPVIEPVEID